MVSTQDLQKAPTSHVRCPTRKNSTRAAHSVRLRAADGPSGGRLPGAAGTVTLLNSIECVLCDMASAADWINACDPTAMDTDQARATRPLNAGAFLSS